MEVASNRFSRRFGRMVYSVEMSDVQVPGTQGRVLPGFCPAVASASRRNRNTLAPAVNADDKAPLFPLNIRKQ